MTAAATTTTRKAREVPPLTPFHALADVADRIVFAAQEMKLPTSKWSQDPVGFAREALGASPWSRQCEILEAVRDYDRVSVRSGHKVGKSNTAALIALWFYSSFEDARVVMTSTTSRQVDEILWREMQKVIARTERAISVARGAGEACSYVHIDGEMHVLARSGLKAADFRQIVGFTAKDKEAVAGISGANLLYIVDEASGVPDEIFEAIEGNRAGGAKIVMFSNPTRTVGEFYASHSREKSALYKCIAISSEDTPNCVEGRKVIPGLATREWVEEKRKEWGTDSALFRVRVKGEFASESSNAVISLSLCDSSVAAWDSTEGLGRLHVGVDIARNGDDETIVAVRRGYKILAVRAIEMPSGPVSPMWAINLCDQIISIVEEFRVPREQLPLVKLDAIGVGEPVFQNLFGLKRFSDLVEAVSVLAYERAPGELASQYDRVRDCLWFAMRDWMREGGAIPDDGKLQQELIAADIILHASGLQKVTAKDDLRSLLKRSPDRADACAMAVWQPSVFDAAAAAAASAPPIPSNTSGTWVPPASAAGAFDPYASRGFDPYRGRR